MHRKDGGVYALFEKPYIEFDWRLILFKKLPKMQFDSIKGTFVICLYYTTLLHILL